MRVSFDTQQDTYEDALAVLRRAYGRRGPVRKQVGATPEGHADTDEVAESASDSAAAVKRESPSKSTTSRVRATKKAATKKAATKKAPTRKAPTRKVPTRKAPTKKAPTKKAPTKKAPTKKAPTKKVASVPVAKRPGRPTRREAAATGAVTNVAPPGQSEAVRAWAREQGLQMSDRGRMPASVITAYEKAHG